MLVGGQMLDVRCKNFKLSRNLKDGMQVVILCGGKGMRLWPHTEEIPKPLVPIGDKPILWHVMKLYSHYGHKDFILCLGFLGEKIKEYFSKPENKEADWNITFVDTGLETNTGGRIKKVQSYIKDDIFLVTYADGVSDVNINDIIKFHSLHNDIATLLAVKPSTHFGLIDIDLNSSSYYKIKKFIEKPVLENLVNGGFFVFDKSIFDYIDENDILEREVFEKLVKEEQLHAFVYTGFWICMDTYKDNQMLNEMWKNDPKWAVWKKSRD